MTLFDKLKGIFSAFGKKGKKKKEQEEIYDEYEEPMDTYEEGYRDGYDDGYERSETRIKPMYDTDEDYYAGYEDGYSDGEKGNPHKYDENLKVSSYNDPEVEIEVSEKKKSFSEYESDEEAYEDGYTDGLKDGKLAKQKYQKSCYSYDDSYAEGYDVGFEETYSKKEQAKKPTKKHEQKPTSFEELEGIETGVDEADNLVINIKNNNKKTPQISKKPEPSNDIIIEEEEETLIINHAGGLLGSVTKDKKQYYTELKKNITDDDLSKIDLAIRRSDSMSEAMELLEQNNFNLNYLVALGFASEEDIQSYRLTIQKKEEQLSQDEEAIQDYFTEVYEQANKHKEEDYAKLPKNEDLEVVDYMPNLKEREERPIVPSIDPITIPDLMPISEMATLKKYEDMEIEPLPVEPLPVEPKITEPEYAPKVEKQEVIEELKPVDNVESEKEFEFIERSRYPKVEDEPIIMEKLIEPKEVKPEPEKDSFKGVENQLLDLLNTSKQQKVNNKEKYSKQPTGLQDMGLELVETEKVDEVLDNFIEYTHRKRNVKGRKVVNNVQTEDRKVYIIFEGVSHFPKIDGYDLISIENKQTLNEYLASRENLLVITNKIPKELEGKLIDWLNAISEDEELYRMVTVASNKVNHNKIEKILTALTKQELDIYYKENPKEKYLNKDKSIGFFDISQFLE